MMDTSKIFIWGTYTMTAMYFRWLTEHYEVVGMATGTLEFPKLFRGIPVQMQDYGVNIPSDALVVIEDYSYNDETKNMLKSVGCDESRFSKMSDFMDAEAYSRWTVNLQIGVLKELLSADDSTVIDYDWMYAHVIEYGIFCFQGNWFKYDEKINWNIHGMQQVSEEFTDYCLSLLTLNVKTAIEIGVFRGRSSYFISSILARRNKDLSYKLVDIEDRLDFYDEYHKVCPWLIKLIPSTSDNYEKEAYDYVFIDADHSYDASIRDWNNVGKYSKVITAFHDIYAHEYDHENGGTVRTWEEIMEETFAKQHRIFTKFPTKWMGIGCVIQKT